MLLFFIMLIAGIYSVKVFAGSTINNTFYLAEGCTRYKPGSTTEFLFHEYVCLQNPNDTAATCLITFMKSDGVTEVIEEVILPTSRQTIYVNDIVPGEDVSTKVESDIAVIVERSMYWDGGGHNTIGVTSPETTWYLAEGCTRYKPGSNTEFLFHEYVCIQNPNDAAATCQVIFMKSDGTTEVVEEVVLPTSRRTIYVNDIVPGEDVSTKVESNISVIVERAMYWSEGSVPGESSGGHVTIGVTGPVQQENFPNEDKNDDPDSQPTVPDDDEDDNPDSEPADIIISCLGDSVTAGYPLTGTQETYPAQLKTMLKDQYGEVTAEVINHGVGGYRADQVLADMEEYSWMGEDPDFVLLMVGGNDLAQEGDVDNLSEVIE